MEWGARCVSVCAMGAGARSWNTMTPSDVLLEGLVLSALGAIGRVLGTTVLWWGELAQQSSGRLPFEHLHGGGKAYAPW